MWKIRIISLLIVILTLSQIIAWSEVPEFKAPIIDQPEWYTSVHQVVLADLDGDGDLDVAAGFDGDGDMEIVRMAWDDYQNLHLWRSDN